MKILDDIRTLSRRYTVAVIVAAAAAALIASPTHAMRHLRLVRSFPAADTVLARSPDTVRLWWSEPPELPFTKIELKNAKGVALKLRPVTRSTDKKDASVAASIVAPLQQGRYDVSWRTMSKDGHVMKGTFAFRVGTPTPRK
jgi:methionine-rich copper-binding protein CopC